MNDVSLLPPPKRSLILPMILSLSTSFWLLPRRTSRSFSRSHGFHGLGLGSGLVVRVTVRVRVTVPVTVRVRVGVGVRTPTPNLPRVLPLPLGLALGLLLLLLCQLLVHLARAGGKRGVWGDGDRRGAHLARGDAGGSGVGVRTSTRVLGAGPFRSATGAEVPLEMAARPRACACAATSARLMGTPRFLEATTSARSRSAGVSVQSAVSLAVGLATSSVLD